MDNITKANIQCHDANGGANPFNYALACETQDRGYITNNSDLLRLLLSNRESSIGGGATQRSCRFCKQTSIVSSQDLADHEAVCPHRGFVDQQGSMGEFMQQQQQQQHQGQQQLQQQQLQHQQQQHHHQQQHHQQHHQQHQLANSFSAMVPAIKTNHFMPTPIHPSQDAKAVNMLAGLNEREIRATIEGTNADVPQRALGNCDFLSIGNSQRQEFSKGPKKFFPFAMPEDDEWLTPLHCFVRRYCVEVFVATPKDVAAPCMGKRNPVSVGQVGIRCPFCSPERIIGNATDIARARENGVVYPSLISRIYNATINLLQRHLRTCAFVPPDILASYEDLKSNNARSGASKKYWADSALRLGLVDTSKGIRFEKPTSKDESQTSKSNEGLVSLNTASDSGSSAHKETVPPPPLVLHSDKLYTTAFTFHLIAQMQPCVFTEADRLGRRRGLSVGFAGLACRHCAGVYGSGRFFPSSIKTMSDASKTLDVIFKHVLKCKKCPSDIRTGLRRLRDFHDNERSKLTFGAQRGFFSKIWCRLHDNRAPSPAPSTLPGVPMLRMNPTLNSDDKEEQIGARMPSLLLPGKSDDNDTNHCQALYTRLSENTMMHTQWANEAA